MALLTVKGLIGLQESKLVCNTWCPPPPAAYITIIGNGILLSQQIKIYVYVRVHVRICEGTGLK